MLAVGVLLLGLFVLIERATANPLLPLRVVLDRNRGASFLASLLVGIALFGMFLFLTYYLQLTLHYSALKSGFAFLPFSGRHHRVGHGGQPAVTPVAPAP